MALVGGEVFLVGRRAVEYELTYQNCELGHVNLKLVVRSAELCLYVLVLMKVSSERFVSWGSNYIPV